LFKKALTSISKSDHYYLLAYLATMNEAVLDAKCLFLNQRFITLQSAIRSFLDAYLNVILLIKEPKYIQFLKLVSLENKRKWLETKLNGKLALLGENGETTRPQFVALLKQTREEIKKSKKPLAPTWDIEGKFKAANLDDVYTGLYFQLSASLHCDLAVVRERHIQIKNGEPIGIIHGQQPNLTDFRETAIVFKEFFPDALNKVSIEIGIENHKFSAISLKQSLENCF
jgi:hypothetical protein